MLYISTRIQEVAHTPNGVWWKGLRTSFWDVQWGELLKGERSSQADFILGKNDQGLGANWKNKNFFAIFASILLLFLPF